MKKFYLPTYYMSILMINHAMSRHIDDVSFTGNGRNQFKKNEIRHIEGIV